MSNLFYKAIHKLRLITALLLFAQTHLNVAFGQAEGILFFHSEIYLNKRNVLKVTEVIKVEARGININRGIYRVLPENRSKSNPLKNVSYEIVSVKKDGVAEPYHIKNENGNTVIYIGDKNTYLPPGQYLYELQYVTANHVGFFNAYDELYWNVTGNEWSFRIDSASAIIHLPPEAKILQHACYTGYTGSTSNNCTVQQIADTVIMWAAKYLNANEGLTVAVGFEKNVITPPPPPGYWQENGLLFFAAIAVALLLLYYFITWYKHGRDPDAPTIIPLFDAPNNVSPAVMGYVNDEHFRNELITSSIINLAIKGYLKINETVDDGLFGLFKTTQYSLTKLKKADNALPAEEKILLNNLFGSSNELALTGSYDSKIRDATNAFTASIDQQYKAFVSKGNNRKRVIIPTLFLIVAILTVAVFDFIFIDRDLPLLVIAAIGTAVLFSISIALGYMYKRHLVLMWVVALLEMTLLICLAYYLLYETDEYLENNLLALAILLLTGAVSVMFYAYLIRKPSIEKIKLQSEIKGLAMYLSAAEEDRLKFFNPPKLTPEVFEKFLPYAMVLGVDEIWGKTFDNLLKNASVENASYKSTWHSGRNLSDAMFSNSLNASLTSSIKSASTPPSSSGSGGGGSSGGGGGGGGGGGW